MPAGALVALSRPNHPKLTHENFNKWYSESHIQDVLATGLFDLAIRYKNTKPDAKWPYIAIYRIPDLAKMQASNALGELDLSSELFPDGLTLVEVADLKPIVLETVQKFEGPRDVVGSRGKFLRTVMISLEDKNVEDFDLWYRKQHLDMLSMIPGFRRSTRYKVAATDGLPTFLACHEYDEASMPIEQLKIIMGTEWSKSVMGSLKDFEADFWEEICAVGKVDEKL